jgi:predicted nucleotidyltransferase
MAKRKFSLDKAINHVLIYLQELQKERLPIERVFLFGSHAKGKARRWSDIDVCVISPKFRDRSHAIEYLWQRRSDMDVENGIEPVGFHPKDFIDEDPLAWEIKTTGIEVWPNHRKKSAKRKNKKKSE